MKYDYDVICIGLGPAGMAVSVMGSEMGLKVWAIERHKIGGECMNVGCIPSKSLVRMASMRHTFDRLDGMALSGGEQPVPVKPFQRIQEFLTYINEKKTLGMFEKVDLLLGEGEASFVDAHTVRVGDRQATGRRIFVCIGTHPAIPPIPGIEQVDVLTNENLFSLESIPSSMVILGGGAIGCEMAQAFSRLGCKCSVIHMDPHLIPGGESDAGNLLESVFKEEGIEVYNGRKITKIEAVDGGVRVHSDQGEVLEGERFLVAAGRQYDPASLKLENAGVDVTSRGVIKVDRYVRTSRKHIYAPGDCNGHSLLSHSAMHQGMLALMNGMMPWPMKQNFKKYVVPWTVFTEPQVSHVGAHRASLEARGIKFRTVELKYEDYGAAIAEGIGIGFVKVYVSALGRIYGARIVGEGSGEMINEWALAIQKKIRMHDIMLLQHSFPTMGFLSKRVSETWMMEHMKSERLKTMCRLMFRR